MNRLLVLVLVFIATVSFALGQKVSYEVYALKFASVAFPLPVSLITLDGPENEYVDAVFMIWLIRGDNNRNILVDAGFMGDIEETKNYAVTNYQRPDSVLLKVGVRAEDITDIILTHPHWDHADGVDLFQNAQVWIQKDDFDYFVVAAWQRGGNAHGFNKRDVSKVVNVNLTGKLSLIDGDDQEVIPGIRVYTGSRHTFNSQYVVVESGTDKIVIASDNANVYYNLNHLKSVAANSTFDTEGYVNAMKRMKTLASDIKFIIPGHDGLVLSRFAPVAEGVVKIK